MVSEVFIHAFEAKTRALNIRQVGLFEQIQSSTTVAYRGRSPSVGSVSPQRADGRGLGTGLQAPETVVPAGDHHSEAVENCQPDVKICSSVGLIGPPVGGTRAPPGLGVSLAFAAKQRPPQIPESGE